MHAGGESRVDGNLASSQCPLWVKSGHRKTLNPCPLYPQIADIGTQSRNVRFVPNADINRPNCGFAGCLRAYVYRRSSITFFASSTAASAVAVSGSVVRQSSTSSPNSGRSIRIWEPSAFRISAVYNIRAFESSLGKWTNRD